MDHRRGPAFTPSFSQRHTNEPAIGIVPGVLQLRRLRNFFRIVFRSRGVRPFLANPICGGHEVGNSPQSLTIRMV